MGRARAYLIVNKDKVSNTKQCKDYILKINKPKLLNFIKKLDIGDGSREAMFFTVSKYMQHNDKHNPHIRKFQVEGHKLMNKAKQQDGENEIDSDKVESYQPFEHFLKTIQDTDYKTINNLKRTQ